MARVRILNKNEEKTENRFSFKRHKLIRKAKLYKRLSVVFIIVSILQFLYIGLNLYNPLFLTTIISRIL